MRPNEAIAMNALRIHQGRVKDKSAEPPAPLQGGKGGREEGGDDASPIKNSAQSRRPTQRSVVSGQ